MTDQPITPADEQVRVEQRHRDAAARLDDELGFLTEIERPLVEQAFARFERDHLTSPAPDAVLRDEAFCAAVWDALKADTNDLRKQQRILNAFRAALASLASTAEGEVEAERWSWGYPDGMPGTSEYEPAARICNRCKTVEFRCVCEKDTT
jgi:hypothetical protein